MVKIGVILNEEDEITSLIDATKIAIYEKEAFTWNKTKEITNCFMQRNSMKQMNQFVNRMIDELKDCKILVASILTGVAYMKLDRAGFMLCEAGKFSQRLLEEISIDYKKSKEKKEEKESISDLNYPTSPYATNIKGVYELDLRKLFKAHPDITSKMAILPFLKKVEFINLIIICSHVMPWLDRDLAGLGCQYKVKQLKEQEYQVDIYKNVSP